MARPSISACIAVYNGAQTLERALRSMLEQTRPPDEILLLDDGSTDASVEIARSFADVKVITQANAGIGAARKRLVEEAAGDWIAFNDHDDSWAPNKLEILEPYTSDPSVDVIYSAGYFVDENGAVTNAPLFVPPDAPRLRHILPNPLNILVPATLIRRQALLDIGNYRPEVRGGEDTLAFFMLLGRGGVVQVPDRLAYIFERSDSESAPRRSTFERELKIYTDYLLPQWDTLFGEIPSVERAEARKLVIQKIAHLKSIIAAWLDWEGEHRLAVAQYLEAIRTRPISKGSWYRLARSLAGRKVPPPGA